MSDIRWLGAGDCHDAASVGGKAASLSQLATRFAVPPGFAVAAMAANRPIPPALIGEIVIAYETLATRAGTADLAVAVRSSAVDEDGTDSSFAGQHATFLNIHGAAAVVSAVERCARSALSTEAAAYRTQRGLALDDVRIAVLVQQLIHADVSAVAFSANPITGDRDEVMITSNWGLGESVVGGTATPDTFIVRKDSHAVTMRAVATKTVMTARTSGGTADVETPPHLRDASSLTDAQLAAIARLATELDAHTGAPVDIECAIAGDALYLLQCRPITTLT